MLSYLKNNSLQEYHAASCSMTQSQANPLIHLFTDTLIKTLNRLNELPEENTLRLIHAMKFFRTSYSMVPNDQLNVLKMKNYSENTTVVKKHCLKNNPISFLDRRVFFVMQNLLQLCS